jgi:hypothetical protein
MSRRRPALVTRIPALLLACCLAASAASQPPSPQAEEPAANTGIERQAAADEAPVRTGDQLARQFKRPEFDLGDAILEVALYLGLLSAIAAAAIYLLRRKLVSGGAIPATAGKYIRLIDRKTLSTRTTLHLLEVDGGRILIAESNQGNALLELAPGSAAEGQLP